MLPKAKVGEILGALIMGGDSCSRSHEFESQYWILVG